jgi:NitT/TauT family transport system permease protein
VTAQIQPLTKRRHPDAKPRMRLRRPSDRVLFGLLGFVIVLPIWEALTYFHFVKRVTISSPTAIVGTAIRDFANGFIQPHLWISAQEYLVGFALAAVTGVAMGLALGMFRRVRYIFEPWLDAVYATPTIALVPLIILVFGIGFQQKVVVVWLEAVFVIVVSVITGVMAAERKHLDTAVSFKASKRLQFSSVVLPTSVPYVLTGMRLGATRALVGVVVAEFLASNAGIGFYINFAGTSLRTDRVMLGVILLGLFGIFVGEAIRRIERRFEKWRPAIH